MEKEFNYKKEFGREGEEHIHVLEVSLLKLEKDSNDEKAVKDILANLHTLKGMATTMESENVKNLSHEIESVFEKILNKKLELNYNIIDLLFNSFDILKVLVNEISEGKKESDPTEIITQLKRLSGARREKEKVEKIIESKDSKLSTKQEEEKPKREKLEKETEPKKTSAETKTLLKEFISEANEYIQSMTDSLLKLEKNPNDQLSAKEFFRNAHTLKSMAATMGFVNLSRLSHGMEEILDKIRNRKLRLDKYVINLLFDSIDALTVLIQQVSEGNEETDLTETIEQLKSIAEGEKQKVELKSILSEELKMGITKIPKVDIIKVDVARLDALMEIVEELLIDKMKLNQIKEELKEQKSEKFSVVLDHIEKLISNLQYNVMEARMMPLQHIFNRFPKMVRDLAKKENKEVNFVIEGGETRLDRMIIEDLGEPLVHLLRNAVNHGIETPEERVKLNKDKQGIIKIIAKREKDYVIIEAEDDGGGIKFKEVVQAAIKKGIIQESQAGKLDKDQILELLLNHSLSTAKEVTDVSGRGVGLSVVKTKIQALGGTIQIISEENKGTKVIMQFPLTLAIIKALLTKVGDETYAIPFTSIVRTIEVKPSDIKTIGDQEMVIVGKQDIPLIRLDKVFNIETPQKSELMMVIVKKGGSRIGLGVDSLVTQQEIIIKQLTKITNYKGFAGATILGKGKVALVLDINSLV